MDHPFFLFKSSGTKGSVLSSVMIFFFKLAWLGRIPVPLSIAVIELFLNLRVQLNININEA